MKIWNCSYFICTNALPRGKSDLIVSVHHNYKKWNDSICILHNWWTPWQCWGRPIIRYNIHIAANQLWRAPGINNCPRCPKEAIRKSTNNSVTKIVIANQGDNISSWLQHPLKLAETKKEYNSRNSVKLLGSLRPTVISEGSRNPS